MNKLIVPVTILALLCIAGGAMGADFNWFGTGIGSLPSGTVQQNTTVYFDPNGMGTTISGSLDLSNLNVGGVVMFGLVDKDLQDSGNNTWQSGAYLYVYKKALTGSKQLRIGVTDGNLNGDIIGPSAGTAQYVTYTDSVDFALTIHDGTMQLTSSLFSGTQSWAYGTVKTLNNVDPYSWNEFQDGAYLGASFFGMPSYGYNVVATNAQSASPSVPEPMSIILGILGLSSVAGFRGLRRK